jgi:hypothetical protein
VVEDEFLIADDLGPLGRLVKPGELEVLEEWDLPRVREERKWVNDRYRKAFTKAEAFRKRLAGAKLAEHGDAVRESFMAWTIEAAKFALCDQWLDQVERLIKQGKQAPMNPSSEFRWVDLPQIQEVVQRVINASDTEIINGATFRAR